VRRAAAPVGEAAHPPVEWGLFVRCNEPAHRVRTAELPAPVTPDQRKAPQAWPHGDFAVLGTWLQFAPLIPLTYPVYILLMAGVLRLCGVSRKDIAAWALHQAGRQRFLDLIAAARRTRELPPAEGDDEKVP